MDVKNDKNETRHVLLTAAENEENQQYTAGDHDGEADECEGYLQWDSEFR